MSVCLSVLMYELSSHWTDFHEICYWGLKIKSDKNIVSFTRRSSLRLYRVIHKSLRDFRNSTAQQPRQTRQKGAYQ